MALLNSKIVRPLHLGEHSVQITDFVEGIATNSNEYITISYKADGEEVVRSKALFATELNLMTVGVSTQVGYTGIDVGELLNQLKAGVPFHIWLVQKEVKGQVFTNWWYTKPVSAPAITTEQPEVEEVM